MQTPPSQPNILVTGGAGYIGSHAAIRLLDDGHAVTVIDNLSRGNRGAIARLARVGGARFCFVECALDDTAKLCEVMRASTTEIVMHFAALAYVGESMERPLEYFTNNVVGGISLLNAMRASEVRKIVFSSTCATYGEPASENIPIQESLLQLPINPYGRSKLQFEEILRAECARANDATPLAAIALRYFNVAGADRALRVGEDHRPESHLIPLALEVAANTRESVTIFGTDYPTHDGTCVRDYVHVEDLVDAHIKSISALQGGEFHAWNVGTGRGHSVREVIESCRRITGHRIPERIGTRRAGDPAQLFADARAITRDLHWHAQHTELDSIVSSAWNWMQANPSGYQ
jgi:UDP-glucose 4-epimerase